MANKLSLRMFLPVLTPLFGIAAVFLILCFIVVILMLIFPGLEQQLTDALFGRRRSFPAVHPPPPPPATAGAEARTIPSPLGTSPLGPDGRPTDPGLRERFEQLKRLLEQPRPAASTSAAQALAALSAQRGGQCLTLALARAVQPRTADAQGWAPSDRGWTELGAALERNQSPDLQAEVRRLIDLAPPLARPALLRALGSYGDLADQERLLRFVHSQESLERLAAVQSLGQVRGPAGREQLLGLLGDADVRVRAEARQALDQYRDPETIRRLKAEAQAAATGPAQKLAQDYARARLKELGEAPLRGPAAGGGPSGASDRGTAAPQKP